MAPNFHQYVEAIQKSGLTIFQPIEIGSELYVPSPVLENLLTEGLFGMSTAGMSVRTRSKRVKEAVCKLLGYPTPKVFKKLQPRFFGQNFDTYVQSSNNLQIWNEELDPTRRYVIIREEGKVLITVRIVTGQELAVLDTTGKLTTKFQAQLVPGPDVAELVCDTDTTLMIPLLSERALTSFEASPVDYPTAGNLLPIHSIFETLKSLIGCRFPDAGRDQERNRGASLHRLVCEAFGYPIYRDDGRFPDLTNQLLEVKLQTSPTIDLGLALPSSNAPLGIPRVGEVALRQSDVRYALFYGQTDGETVSIQRLYVTTGERFFSRFRQFGGNVTNSKIQIPLPRGFFADTKGNPNLLI